MSLSLSCFAVVLGSSGGAHSGGESSPSTVCHREVRLSFKPILYLIARIMLFILIS